MSTRIHLTAFLSLCVAAIAFAQAEQPATPPPESQPAAAPAVAVEGSGPSQSSVSRDRDTLSVDFPDEDIKTILRNVADLFEINLVIPDTLTGKTSIKLRDVTWRQIFQVVLSPVGYTYVEEGNIIKVVSNESLLQEPVSTDVIIINNAKAADILPTISAMVDTSVQGAKIVIDARSNALVITERPSRMGRIRETIEKLDKATDQVMIETKFVEVTDRDIRNIGVNWASLQGFQVGVGGMTQEFSRNRGQSRNAGVNSNSGTTSSSSNQTGSNSSNSTTSGTNTSTSNGTSSTTSNGTTGSTRTGSTGGDTITYVTGLPTAGTTLPSTINFPAGTVSGLPSSVPAITGQANFAPGDPTATPPTPDSATALNTFNGSTTNEVSNETTTSTSNGTTGSTTNGTSGNTSNSLTNTLANTLTQGANNALSNLMGLTNTGGTSRLTNAVFSASDFNLVLSALKTQNNTKVVSNPTVVTLNNTEAILNIGSEFPIPSYTYNSERGTFEVSGFQYKPIGVILKVTPQVNAQGLIRLNLEPEISQQADQTTFGGAGGAQIPIISTRKVKTQVSLKDGYTVGLGGLISTAKSHGGNKVPVLGDIPGLGRLFSSRNVNDTTTNLLIFLTARTVSADGAVPSDIFAPSAMDAVGDMVPAKR